MLKVVTTTGKTAATIAIVRLRHHRLLQLGALRVTLQAIYRATETASRRAPSRTARRRAPPAGHQFVAASLGMGHIWTGIMTESGVNSLIEPRVCSTLFRHTGTALVAAALVGGKAYAYCIQPSSHTLDTFPQIYATPPDQPFCMSTYRYTGKHNCDSWEIDNYFDEVKDYQTELELYLLEVERFMRDAAEMAQDAEEFAFCSLEEIQESLE